MAVIVRNGGGSLVGSKSSGMMFTVELPPSKPYTQAAEWIKVTSSVPPFEGANSIVSRYFALMSVGNNLVCFSRNLTNTVSSNSTMYEVGGSYMYKINPANGAFTKTKVEMGQSVSYRWCSDGKQFIYCFSPVGLEVIDVMNETRSRLFSMSDFPLTDFNVSGASEVLLGAIAYDDIYKRVYICGILRYYGSKPHARTDYLGWYDLNTSTLVTNRVAIGNFFPASFAYCDSTDGTLYLLRHTGGLSSSTSLSTITDRIYQKFNPSNNTFSTIVSNPSWSGYSSNSSIYVSMYTPSYVTLGDTGYVFNGSSVYAFDIKTGSAFTSQMPGAAPGVGAGQYGGMSAKIGNTLYYMDTSGFYKCVLYENLPADAPVVCKIYKGQKYHSIEPFNVGSKLSVKRTQQTATSDIEIKMYEYDSGGGQILYIET